MPAENDVTIGELSRMIAAMDNRMAAQFDAVNRRFDGLQFVNRETYNVEVGTMKERLNDLEDAKQWIARAFIAAFLFPVLVGVIIALAVAR